MGWFSKVSKAVKKVYDATSDVHSSFGKYGKWAFPLNSQYWIRYGYGKLMDGISGSADTTSAGSYYGGSVYGPTGSIVGRY